ncbi:Uncharacterised protein [Pseudomonas fluorescens]|uniref:Uncharacterized protein n=1 Tax=Pseudomonas fluorescens TaxID=294 RepID=A0A448DVM6_PSEFL|nr:hypothetical protein [Pseudomonas fluorescens]VEF10874.1 Uncharacterised protein [Pseudomonas fluorescens]
MNTELLAANKVVFKAERSISLHGYSDSAPYLASVEIPDGNVSLVLDHSEYRFTAQQCAEVTKNLVKMLLKYADLGMFQVGAECVARLEALAAWIRLFQAQSLSAERDSLQTFESDSRGSEFCASGSFRQPELHHGEAVYYKLVICLDDDLNLPCLGIDDRAFAFNFEQAF